MKLSELAKKLGVELRPAGEDAVIVRVANARTAGPEAIVFAEDETTLLAGLSSSAAALIVSAKLGELVGAGRTVLVSKQPRLTFARAARLLALDESDGGIHSTAVIAATA